MTVKQGLYARAAAFAAAAVVVVLAVETFGRVLAGLLLGEERAASSWEWTRMGAWSVGFVFAMLAIGRLGAAASYREAEPDPSDPSDPER